MRTRTYPWEGAPASGSAGRGRSATGGLPFESAESEPPEGSLPALSTDGLIESAGHDVDAGLTTLARTLTRPAGSLEELCDNVLYGPLRDRPGDDIALLIARTRALDARQVVTWELPDEPVVVADARGAAGEHRGNGGSGRPCSSPDWSSASW